jgi:TatD DNase family protein
MQWTDSHCHLDEGYGYDGGVEGVLARARGAGVVRLVVVGTDGPSSRRALDLAAAHDGVFATVGLHPHDAVNGVDTVAHLLGGPGVHAVGECGLDYHYDHSPRDVQRAAFVEQVRLAHHHGLPLVIHTREAWPDTFDVLDREGVPERTIFHCFTGGPAEARTCVDLGAYLSFSGIVTFKTATDLREAAARCPADRLLVETDAPYLAPVPHRGRRNEPAYLPAVGAVLADVRGEPVASIAEQTAANALVAFGLPDL